MLRVLSLVGLFVCVVVPQRTIAGEHPGQQANAHLDTQIPLQMDYLLYLPEDYEQQEAWPLVLFLHGAGERGDDLELVKVHGPPKLIAGGMSFPFVCVSPQCPKETWWDPTQLTALLDEVIRTHNIDEERIYVTGLSMGGFGTWELAQRTPNRFAAIAPICGGGETIRAKNIAHLPIWVFHGAMDTGIVPERSQVMVEALKEAGGNPRFTLYPEAGHDCWTETYNNPEFYDWLLSQRRQSRD